MYSAQNYSWPFAIFRPIFSQWAIKIYFVRPYFLCIIKYGTNIIYKNIQPILKAYNYCALMYVFNVLCASKLIKNIPLSTTT